mmetsp:Transcript_90836/g.265919  ORF Transcript_90836/g.265919 Transcript_90836/m.265919 type:complete len:367 (-) Transcript_90836:40-1140(-)
MLCFAYISSLASRSCFRSSISDFLLAAAGSSGTAVCPNSSWASLSLAPPSSRYSSHCLFIVFMFMSSSVPVPGRTIPVNLSLRSKMSALCASRQSLCISIAVFNLKRSSSKSTLETPGFLLVCMPSIVLRNLLRTSETSFALSPSCSFALCLADSISAFILCLKPSISAKASVSSWGSTLIARGSTFPCSACTSSRSSCTSTRLACSASLSAASAAPSATPAGLAPSGSSPPAMRCARSAAISSTYRFSSLFTHSCICWWYTFICPCTAPSTPATWSRILSNSRCQRLCPFPWTSSSSRSLATLGWLQRLRKLHDEEAGAALLLSVLSGGGMKRGLLGAQSSGLVGAAASDAEVSPAGKPSAAMAT